MDKFLKLLKIEMQKVIKRKSTYILLGVLIILSVTNPVLEKLFENVIYDFDTKYLESVIQYEKNQNITLKDEEKNVSDIKLIIYEKEKDIINIENSLNLDKLTYLYESFNTYRESYYEKNALDLINEYGLDSVTEAFNTLEYYIPFDYVEANYKILLKDSKNWDENYNEVKENFERAEKDFNSSKDALKYVENKVSSYEELIKENNEYLSNLKDEKEVQNITILNEAYSYNLEVLNYTKKLITEEKLDFDINYLKLCIDIIEKNESLAIEKYSKMDEKEFNLSLSIEDKAVMTYEKYLKIFELRQQNEKNEILRMEYALKHKLYESIYDNENIGRSLVERGYSTGTIFIIISIIVSILIAKEFTTGSIRLLLIRPVKRWKILLAKLLTVVIVTLLMTVVAYISLLISCSVIFGFDELNIPNLEVINGSVVEQNMIFESIKYTCLTLISTFSLICIALAFAIFSRSPAATIAASLAIYFGTMIFNIETINSPKIWLQYTIIPYIDFSNFSDSNILNMIMQNNIKYSMDITVERGIITFAILSIVLITLSIIRFNKMDIKNT